MTMRWMVGLAAGALVCANCTSSGSSTKSDTSAAQQAASGQFQPGDDVRAAYQVVDGKPTAVRIDVTSRKSSTGSGKSTGSGTDAGSTSTPR